VGSAVALWQSFILLFHA